jgi:GNAT superfamily N-acetyltransferase
MPIKISPIRPEDIAGAARCIQSAFKDDPYFKWVFDPSIVSIADLIHMAPPSRRVSNHLQQYNPERNLSSLTLRCEWGIQNALFYVAKDPDSTQPEEVLAISMWLPPKPASEPESWSSFLSSYLLWFKQGLLSIRHMGRGGLIYRRYVIWKHSQAEAQKQIWTDPNGYYFCNIVVVSPDRQGMGLGRKVMEVVTDQADREGRKCYLESSREEPNVSIYEKMGFRVVKNMTCQDNGEKCDLFCMVRDPKSELS